MNTLKLCESELCKYMREMTGEKGEIRLISGDDKDLFREHIEIDVQSGKGVIRGNRPRALLLGVYEFLRRCGCRFVRPGRLGEQVPKRDISDMTVHADITPANRHRGITIEGAVSLQNVLDIVEWAPKAGFNSYFLQFRTAYEFFDRWYSHARNPLLAPQAFTHGDSENFVEKIVAAIKERDMIYHAVGHGWTAACLDMEGESWKVKEASLNEEQRSMLASVNGKREFFGGVPLNTQLCYSNPKVRARMAEEVVKYAKSHREADVIHFWLADNYNNVCECENCAKKRFSDWYVMMLNDIDRRLTEEGIDVKICFLVYFELYWPPLTERIINEDRFIMMFAPLMRTYTQSYAGAKPSAMPEYKLNQIKYPRDIGAYLGFLENWQKIFKGDSFDFDYHLMWDINRDFGGEALAEILYRDVRSLKDMGLNGFMSCQVQRAFYPSGLAFYVMGRALFDGAADFAGLREEYYSAAFGKNAEFAKKIYSEIEEKVPFAYFEGGRTDSDLKKILPGLKEVKAFLERVASDLPEGENETCRESLAVLGFAANNVAKFLNVIILKTEGAPPEETARAEEERKRYFNSNEMRFQPYADGFYVNMITEGLIASRETGIYA